MDPITQARSSFTKVKMAREREAKMRESKRLRVAGREGQKEAFRRSSLLASSLSKVVIPLQEVNKITPYGYDIMQMRSRREDTLIATESQIPRWEAVRCLISGGPHSVPSTFACWSRASSLEGFQLPATLRGFLVKCHEDKIRNRASFFSPSLY